MSKGYIRHHELSLTRTYVIFVEIAVFLYIFFVRSYFEQIVIESLFLAMLFLIQEKKNTNSCLASISHLS